MGSLVLGCWSWVDSLTFGVCGHEAHKEKTHVGCRHGWHKAAQHDARPQDGGRHCGIRRPRDLDYSRRFAGVELSRGKGQSCGGWKRPFLPLPTEQRVGQGAGAPKRRLPHHECRGEGGKKLQVSFQEATTKHKNKKQ